MPSHGPAHDPHAQGKKRLMHTLMAQMDVEGASPVGAGKARDMLRHGTVHGKKLTRKQRGLFGLIAGGGTPTRQR